MAPRKMKKPSARVLLGEICDVATMVNIRAVEPWNGFSGKRPIRHGLRGQRRIYNLCKCVHPPKIYLC